MSSLVRRSIIFAAVEGLVIQGHGNKDQNKSILIEYGTQRLSERARVSHVHTHPSPRLEAFGIIGDAFLNKSFLPKLIEYRVC